MGHRLNGGVLSARCSAADLEIILKGPEKVVGLEKALPVGPAPFSPLDLIAEMNSTHEFLLQKDACEIWGMYIHQYANKSLIIDMLFIF